MIYKNTELVQEYLQKLDSGSESSQNLEISLIEFAGVANKYSFASVNLPEVIFNVLIRICRLS